MARDSSQPPSDEAKPTKGEDDVTSAPAEVEASVDAQADKPKADRDAREDDDAGDRKKERVLHTRVPAVLEQELKRLAENIRVPVSNLVRAILEDAVEMADRAGRGVEEELRHAATTLSSKRSAILGKKDRAPRQPNALEGVIGFQPLTLASDARCARCERALDAGEDAHLGLNADVSAPRVIVCSDCLPKKKK
jgi:hypothetical protein